MTSVYLVSAFIIIACITVCVMFVRQTIEKRHRERARLVRALEKRGHELAQMLSGFPPHFLPRDIIVLIYRCLIDTYQQLSRLETNKMEYMDLFKTYSEGMEKALSESINNRRVTLQSAQQIGDIKRYLVYLSRFLIKLTGKGSIDKRQFAHYNSMLKLLSHQMSVDNYCLAAIQAQQSQKDKLALHYLKLAQKIILQDGVMHEQKEQITEINQRISECEQRITQEEPQIVIKAESRETDASKTEKEWETFQQDAGWKKKTIYD